MTQQRIMLLGAAGQIGQAMQYLAAQTALPADWKLGLFSRAECDITNPAALRASMQDFAPTLVINAAGLTNVDEAEKEPLTADAVNFHAVAQMAAQCSVLDVPLIHLSTDYVFDGLKTTPYLPDDLMNPLNKYGASKLMGEESVRHELPFHVILRVSSVFSAFRRNIMTNIINTFQDQEELRVVSDMIAAPTPALDVAKTIITMGTALLGGKMDGFGTFHFCGAPACSRYEFTESLMKAYAPYAKHMPRLTAISSAEVAPLAKRPHYSVLDCAKINDVYGITQPNWQDGLSEAVDILVKAGRTPR